MSRHRLSSHAFNIPPIFKAEIRQALPTIDVFHQCLAGIMQTDPFGNGCQIKKFTTQRGGPIRHDGQSRLVLLQVQPPRRLSTPPSAPVIHDQLNLPFGIYSPAMSQARAMMELVSLGILLGIAPDYMCCSPITIDAWIGTSDSYCLLEPRNMIKVGKLLAARDAAHLVLDAYPISLSKHHGHGFPFRR
ncbi:MAG: hypothetical protein BGO63_03825 [Candidatus Accumulibacter sp. 66-26]|nr:MAG: hypothetical protein BGO63_03825 [Candidatus Accumulibacter sp. 66-26]